MDFETLVASVEEQPETTVEVRLLLDPDAAAQHQKLELELADALSNPTGSLADRGPGDIADDIRNLMESASPTVFVFKTVGARQWSQLIAKHPPSKADRERYRDVADTFWPDAMAASCVEPEGATRDGFVKLWERLSDGQWERLRSACREANVGLFDISPSSAASVLLNGRRLKSE